VLFYRVLQYSRTNEVIQGVEARRGKTVEGSGRGGKLHWETGKHMERTGTRVRRASDCHMVTSDRVTGDEL
jgi:hypothetical protein